MFKVVRKESATDEKKRGELVGSGDGYVRENDRKVANETERLYISRYIQAFSKKVKLIYFFTMK
ncbi:MAG: hypothetical protein D3917_12035 [Candidatus Electrothrix sp. AX5]|uniref:Uncharacterized protein n=1 Tax=Candidatus Electrothrix aarhusensis TaxID=1859131 RepID=A0A3S3RR80_9BACT|nr:hypothetical protein [Candidatus Electrothrix sp. AX5]RWX45950.1 hypothetical protein H206_00017 [Candidatus Electrothrix aarhusensis]